MTTRSDVMKTRFIVNFIVASNIYYKGTKNKRIGDHYLEPLLNKIPCAKCRGSGCKFQFHNIENCININMCFYITSLIKLFMHYFKDGRIKWIEDAKEQLR